MTEANLTGYNLTTFQIAEKLGYHPQYVRALALSGKIPALKRGRAWLFSEAEVLKHFKLETTKHAGGNDALEGGQLLR